MKTPTYEQWKQFLKWHSNGMNPKKTYILHGFISHFERDDELAISAYIDLCNNRFTPDSKPAVNLYFELLEKYRKKGSPAKPKSYCFNGFVRRTQENFNEWENLVPA